jgi:CO/xanthine dehydrogenase Mo-binding subunit/aerobic-type carbon monoxide dehydrogenase small subunit (CoxS/CutS family)
MLRLAAQSHHSGGSMNSPLRREGPDKLSGQERYIDDLQIEGGWWGMTARSPSPRGRIREVRFGDGVDWSEFVVVDFRDIPGPNEIRLIELDQPMLAADRVRHIHEAVVLVAHPSRAMCRRAIEKIEIVVDPEPAVFDFRLEPRADQIQHGEDNVFSRLGINKGDVEVALASAAHVIEGVYETGAQEHAYLENQGMAAWLDGDVLVVQGSMQCPYYVLNALMHALGREESMLRVVQTPTGGGFGGKEDYPSNLALHAALLALKAGRPVKIIYDRAEDMAATTKRHPSRVRHRTGVTSDGRLLAQDIEVVIDAGAYTTLSPVVLSRGIIHAGGPYACDNVRIRGRAMLTNSVPYGAFRGFGAPQSQFAVERHMDVIARCLGIDPIELRRRNLIRDGQSTSTSQVVEDGTDRAALLELAVKKSEFFAKRTAHTSFNAASPHLRRGMGLATFYHGGGFTGSGEDYLEAKLHVRGRPDGSIEVLSASTEMGQGTQTIFVSIVAARLGVDPASVEIATPDTSRVPNSGPTAASRTAQVVGLLLERACDDLRANIDLTPDDRGETVQQAIRDWHTLHPGEELLGRVQYQKPPNIAWDEETYRGDAYGAFAWGAYVAEVEVDLRTYECRVVDFHAIQEVGRVLNETLATGQIQGGVVQAIGWALLENCVWQDGAMKNNQLANYIIPTALDVPPISVTFLESPYEHGGGGAKGLGELPMDGPAPAILNAVASALGIEPTTIPLTPERLMELLTESNRIEVAFTLNGREVVVGVDPADRLLDTLRYQLGLTGAKEGCGEGECGACTVCMNGNPVNSCLVPTYQARGSSIQTVESVKPEAVGALLESGGTQCGACTPGVVLTALWIVEHRELLETHGVRELMAGNLCRCTGYDGIINGIDQSLASGGAGGAV